MEALLDYEALRPPSTQEMPKEEPPEQTQTAGQNYAEEEVLIPMPTTEPPPPVNLAMKPDPPQSPTQAEGDLLDEVADMNIPKTINMESFDDDEDRAKQVISPDGSTYDGTSTIGSATSEPTHETGLSRGTRSTRKGTTASGRSTSGRSATSRGGNSRGGNSRGGNSRGGNRGGNNRSGTSSSNRNLRSG